MKKYVFLLLGLLLFQVPFMAHSQPFHNKAEADTLRNFMRRPSAQSGKLNIDQLWKSAVVDTSNWTTNNNSWMDSITGLSFVVFIEPPVGANPPDTTFRVRKIEWSNKNLGDFLNLYDFRVLDTVQCSGNKLTAFKSDGSDAIKQLLLDGNRLKQLNVSFLNALKHLSCEKNALLFSSLPQVKVAYTFYSYNPQDTIKLTQGIADTVDLSKEYSVYGQTTSFVWFEGGAQIPAANFKDMGNGKFIFPDTYMSKTLVCRMQNSSLPALTQVALLVLSESYKTSEIDKLKAFLQLPSATNGKSNGEVLGLPAGSDWSYSSSLLAALKGLIIWDNGVPKQVLKIDWNNKGVAGSLDVSGFTKMTELIVNNNRLLGLNVSGNSALSALRCGANLLKFSTLPKENITPTYVFSPQSNINDTILISDVLDLSAEYSIARVGGSPNITQYRFVYSSTVTTDGIQDLGGGKFRLADKYAARSIICEMTNAAFSGLTIKCIVYVKAVYDTAELSQLKVFLRQPSAETGKDNIDQVGTKPTDWNYFNSVAGQLTGIVWDNSNPKKVQSINWSGKNLGGSLTLRLFGKIESINCSQNSLINAALSRCASLTTVLCNNNDISSIRLDTLAVLNHLSCENNKFLYSTLPKQNIATYSFSPQQESARSIFVYEQLNLSSENSVTRGGTTNQTDYVVYDLSGTPLSNDLYEVLPGGFISFAGSLEGSTVICKLTNEGFSGLVLSIRVELRKPHYDDNEMAELEGFLGLPSAEGGKTNAEQLGIDMASVGDSPGKWPASAGAAWFMENGNAYLQELRWSKRNLAGDINFANFSRLKIFLCAENSITNLNLANTVRLEELDCFKNSIQTLNVQGCASLLYLTVSQNGIKTLDLSSSNLLKELFCQQNNLEQLNLTGCGNLKVLSCIDNKLSNLNLSDAVSLEKLYCTGNALKFSTLPTPSYPTYTYDYQDSIYFRNMTTANTIDLSSELNISRNGSTHKTIYKWYLAGSDTPITDGITESNGIFTFNSSFENKAVYGTMTNAAFPKLTLHVQVNFFTVGENKPLINAAITPEAILYPNPATDMFNLKVSNFSGKLNMAIINNVGRVMLEQELHIFENENKQISIQNLSKGIYYVRLHNKEFSKMLKLIVQ